MVKWVDLPKSENSWELKSSIQQEFPHFYLGDKVDLQGGAIDKNHRFGKVYARKTKREWDVCGPKVVVGQNESLLYGVRQRK